MNGVLIVDDNRNFREHLVKELAGKYSPVTGVSTGPEALEELKKHGQDYRFAVIDQYLNSDMDGIATTKELLKLCPGLYPVVFTNYDSFNPSEQKKNQYQALEAGAYRYLVKGTDGKLQIETFIQEMEQLKSLRTWIAEFHDARAAAPSLLTQLKIGMVIIDRQRKVWYMNEAMRKITGVPEPGLPTKPCSHWHDITDYPCEGCLSQKTFCHGKPEEGIFLSRMIFRKDQPLCFLKVWSQDVRGQNPTAETLKTQPFAVMESVLELTGTDELKYMPLETRLGIIAKAIKLIRKGKFTSLCFFQYVRIYVLDQDNHFILKAHAGDPNPDAIGQIIQLRHRDGTRLAQAEDHMRSGKCGYWFEHADGYDPVMPVDERIPFIYWPIIQNGRTIAVLEIGGPEIAQNTAEEQLPQYAAEIHLALKDDQQRQESDRYVADAAKLVNEFDCQLQTQTLTAEEQLKLIINEACRLTNCHQYLLRYRNGDNATLLHLRVQDYHAYEDLAPLHRPLSFDGSWSCRTILTGMENVANTRKQHKILTDRKKLSLNLQKVLQNSQSLCFEPLIIEGYCIGSLGFHGMTIDHFSNNRLAILRPLAKRAALALKDYLMEQKAREEVEIEARILNVVLHNLKTPLASVQFAFTNLMRKNPNLSPDSQKHISTIQNQLNRISELRSSVIKLCKPWESRIESICVQKEIQNLVQQRVRDQNIQISDSFDSNVPTSLHIDKPALHICLEILLDNANDALKDVKGKKLGIHVRSETSRNRLAISVQDNGPGVPVNFVERLFTDVQSDKPCGTGLGLIHCQKIATSAHGEVSYDSQHSPGAKFTLFLPYTTKGV